MTKPIDTTDIRTRLYHKGFDDFYPIDIHMLCDEIDRLRGVQTKLEAIRDAAVSVSLTWSPLKVHGKTCSVVDHDKITALSNAILRENDHSVRQQTPPQGKTISVKIAVAVDTGEHWRAEGWDNAPEGMPEDRAKKRMDGKFALHYITVALPVPQEVEVKAGVENENINTKSS